MAGLEGSVTLPAFGTVKKKTAAEVGAGAVVLVLVIWWWKQRQAATAAASSPSSSSASGTPAGQVTDPAGNVCDASAINAATGYCTGSAQDLAASSGAGLDYAGGGGGLSGNGLSGYYYNGAGASSTAPGPGNFADNAEWAQYVLAYLTSSAGGDSGTVSTAIGLYLTGAQVTTDQAAIIDEAIAYGGTPPQAGASGDPPGINLVAGSTGTGTSSAGSTSVGSWPTSSTTDTSSSSSSTSSAAAAAKAAPAGAISNLQATVSGTSATVHWNPATGASQGYAYELSELNGTVNARSTTKATSISFHNLHKGWTYNFGIQGLPGGPGDNIHIVIPN